MIFESQWAKLVAFIEISYRKMVGVAKFSAKAAWNLMGRYVVAFFESLRPYRAAVTGVEDINEVGAQGAVMWAILQCHRKIREFILVDFEGHPVIVREMSLFMLTERVDPAQITTLVATNQQLESEVKALTKRVKTLEDTGSSLKRDFNSLSNEFKQFKKKICKVVD